MEKIRSKARLEAIYLCPHAADFGTEFVHKKTLGHHHQGMQDKAIDKLFWNLANKEIKEM